MDLRFRLLRRGVWMLSVLLQGCKEDAPYVKPPTPVRVATVEEFRGAPGLRYSADIRPQQQISLAFRAGGYVEEVARARGLDGAMRLLQEGDPVKKGLVLVRLREKEYSEKFHQAKGRLSEALVAAQQARLEFERAESRLASSTMTQADYEGVQAKWEAAQARLVQARSAVEEAQLLLDDCALKAPLDGIVLRRQVEPGALATLGQAMVVVADVSSVKVVFGVPDILIRSVEIGQTICVATESIRGERFEGRVTRVSPWADPRSRVFEVEITVPNADGKLKVGMIANLRLNDPKEGPPEPVIPLGAVVRPGGSRIGYGVFVVEERDGASHARLKPVELGAVHGSQVAVKQGVSLAERVIVVGSTLVTDGQIVRVVP